MKCWTNELPILNRTAILKKNLAAGPKYFEVWTLSLSLAPTASLLVLLHWILTFLPQDSWFRGWPLDDILCIFKIRLWRKRTISTFSRPHDTQILSLLFYFACSKWKTLTIGNSSSACLFSIKVAFRNFVKNSRSQKAMVTFQSPKEIRKCETDLFPPKKPLPPNLMTHK